MIIKKDYDAPQLSKAEVLRYSGASGNTEQKLDELADECIKEAAGRLTYKVCYDIFDVVTDGKRITLAGGFEVESSAFSKLLAGCDSVLVFAATVGVGLDRLIARYGEIRPSKALMMQSLGAERIEALCDAFCDDIGRELAAEGKFLTRRFSPGYADLPLDFQRAIFRLLSPEMNIGLTLNDSLLMTPSKSVTAIAGVTVGEPDLSAVCENKCALCGKTDCAFRSS
jgi:hypothetical protein